MVKTIGEICDILSGYAFDSKLFTDNTQDTPLIRIRDVMRGYTTTYTNENFDKKYLVKKGDLLIGMDGEFNIAPWNSANALLNQRVCKIWCSSNEVIEKYVFYFLPKALKDIEQVTSFVTVKHLSVKAIKEIQIQIPSLDKQKQIAKTLDTASELLAMRKQQLAELDNFIKSTFYDMFGDLAFNNKQWNTRELVGICKKENDIKCGPFGTQLNKDEYQTSGVPLWGIPQVNAFFLIPTKDFLSEEKAESLEAYSIIADDITMSRKGNVGKCAIYPRDLPKGIMHSDVLRIRVNQEVVNPTFILHQLHLSRYIQNQIKLVSSGAIMAGVNVSKLKHILVHIPPIELQNGFAEIASKIEEQKALVKKAIDETQNLFDSLISEYFE